MYYYEKLIDGTVLGLYDNTVDEGLISEHRYYTYHELVAKREHPRIRNEDVTMSAKDWPLRAIENAKIRTALISTYRIHSKQNFETGNDFPKTWRQTEEKIQSSQRFSPPGTIGYYFGLTVDAALDEASSFLGWNIEEKPDPSKILLVHRSYYTDLLYLAPVLPAVWEYLNFPPIPTWEMYIAVMNRNTSNEITNAIGLMARNLGFKGIIFPSARYGQRLDLNNETISVPRFPMLNFVEIGSNLCEDGAVIELTLAALIGGLLPKPNMLPPMIVDSEPNLVIFDEATVAGLDRPVFYMTYELKDVSFVKTSDERIELKHKINYMFDGARITLFVDNPKFKFLLHSST